MNVESFVEKTLFASRWLLCPLYLGLALLLVLFSIHFFRELIDIAIRAFSLTETDLVIQALTLIDLALAGGLVVMIMLSGYENFVSKLDVADAEKKYLLARQARYRQPQAESLRDDRYDFGGTAAQSLSGDHAVANDKLLWMVVIHLTFVVSALLLTVMDRLLGAAARH
jgi:uncharacterized membrane protein YqhA